MPSRPVQLLSALALALMLAPPAALAGRSSLPKSAGPQILHAKPRTAPQLKNRGIWEAPPILISGASAYRDGEFLYQDYIYDDTGAKGSFSSADPKSSATFARFNGTISYPTDPAYAQNAADLLELRVKPLAKRTALRLSYNSMTDPDLVGTTVAIGESAGPQPFPHGANVSAPAELFLTVHGNEAELLDAAGGAAITPAPRVKVSRRRHQIEVRISRRAWDPGRRKIRMAAGSGLWDAARGGYLVPSDNADASTPGGAGNLTDPAAFFNVAFRYEEPFPDIADTAAIFADPKWWRDDAQAAALAEGDISAFSATVDFRKLRRGKRDEMLGEPGGTPESGPMDRILSSRFSFGQGADWAKDCLEAADCSSQLLGRLLPYSIYVPERPRPERGYPLTLLLHSLGANYNQFAASNNQSQFGERGPGSIVITPSGRGTDGWYYGAAGADTFEVWADVARHFRLDPRMTAIGGYSMGGYGTYKLATQYPDLFAAAQPTVGPPGYGVWLPPSPPSGGAGSNTNRMLASLRHVPVMIWNGVLDELVPFAGAAAQAATFDELGYPYAFYAFPGADHFALASNDSFGPAADFLGAKRAPRNPARVTYVVNPTMDFADRLTVADRAYWLSRLRLRDASGEAPLGSVDALSEGFGRSEGPVPPGGAGAGSLPPGNLGTLAYAERGRGRPETVATPREDRLELTVENLRRVVIDAERARLSCRAKLAVETDGPVRVKLAGCRGRAQRFG